MRYSISVDDSDEFEDSSNELEANESGWSLTRQKTKKSVRKILSDLDAFESDSSSSISNYEEFAKRNNKWIKKYLWLGLLFLLISASVTALDVYLHNSSDDDNETTSLDNTDAVNNSAGATAILFPEESSVASDVNGGKVTEEHLDQWYILPDLELMICAIPGAHEDLMRSFGTLIDVKCNDIGEGGCGYYGRDVNHIQDMIESDWIKMVFLREPKERFLLGYQTICTRNTNTCYPSAFENFINKMGENWYGTDERFMLQTNACGGIGNIINFFDFIGIAGDMNTMRSQLQILSQWPKYERMNNEFVRDAIKTIFDGKEKFNANRMLKQYYNKGVARYVEKLYEEDYKLLREISQNTFANVYVTSEFKKRMYTKYTP